MKLKGLYFDEKKTLTTVVQSAWKQNKNKPTPTFREQSGYSTKPSAHLWISPVSIQRFNKRKNWNATQ